MMNELFLIASAAPAAEGGNVVQEISRQFGFNSHHFFAQCVSFAIVAFALWKWAYNPILKVLEERRNRIKEGLDNAAKIKEELARTEVQRQEILVRTNNEANRLIEEARAAANRVREQETQRAVAEAEQIIVRAREAAEIERNRILLEARRELGRLIVSTTQRVTGKVLTAEDQRRLAEETSRQLAE